jgi:hypothetical protein
MIAGCPPHCWTDSRCSREGRWVDAPWRPIAQNARPSSISPVRVVGLDHAQIAMPPVGEGPDERRQHHVLDPFGNGIEPLAGGDGFRQR